MIYTPDPLSHWWWPGQWLRLVWGIWVDPLWYWRNVRPRLQSALFGIAVLAQGIAGSLIVALFIALMMSFVTQETGDLHYWAQTIQRIGLALVLALGMSAFLALAAKVFDALDPTVQRSSGVRINELIVRSIALSLLLCSTLGSRTIETEIARSINGALGIRMLFVSIAAVLMGITFGISEGVTTGQGRGLFWCIILTLLSSFVISRDTGILLSIWAGIWFSSGLYLGGYWATRQIDDPSLRKSLANPISSQP